MMGRLGKYITNFKLRIIINILIALTLFVWIPFDPLVAVFPISTSPFQEHSGKDICHPQNEEQQALILDLFVV